MSKLSIYELAVLYDCPSEAAVDKVVKAVKKLLSDTSATILKEDVWGQRRLAYPIKKRAEAFYVFYDIEIDPNRLPELENGINLNEAILRHQIYKPDLKALAKALATPVASSEPEVVAEPVSAEKVEVKDGAEL